MIDTITSAISSVWEWIKSPFTYVAEASRLLVIKVEELAEYYLPTNNFWLKMSRCFAEGVVIGSVIRAVMDIFFFGLSFLIGAPTAALILLPFWVVALYSMLKTILRPRSIEFAVPNLDGMLRFDRRVAV